MLLYHDIAISNSMIAVINGAIIDIGIMILHNITKKYTAKYH